MATRETLGIWELSCLLTLYSTSAFAAKPCGEGQYRDLHTETCGGLEAPVPLEPFSARVGILASCHETSLRSALVVAREAGEPRTVHLPDACVLQVRRPIRVPSNVRLFGHGTKIAFRSSPTACDPSASFRTAAVVVSNADNVVLEDLLVEVAGDNACGGVDAVKIHRSRNVLVDRVAVYGARGRGAAGIEVTGSSEVAVRFSHAHTNTRGIVVSQSSRNVSVYSNFVVDNEEIGILAAGKTAEYAGNRLIGNARGAWLVEAGVDVRFHHNTLDVVRGMTRKSLLTGENSVRANGKLNVHSNRLLDSTGARVDAQKDEVAHGVRASLASRVD